VLRVGLNVGCQGELVEDHDDHDEDQAAITTGDHHR
jgi:hypothetical protein